MEIIDTGRFIREHAIAKEKHLMRELMRLRTHRMNVVWIVTPDTYRMEGTHLIVVHRSRLELLLPRGPRPLP